MRISARKMLLTATAVGAVCAAVAYAQNKVDLVIV